MEAHVIEVIRILDRRMSLMWNLEGPGRQARYVDVFVTAYPIRDSP